MPSRIKRKRHERQCQRKKKTDSQLRAVGASRSLDLIGINWPAFQQIHHRTRVGAVLAASFHKNLRDLTGVYGLFLLLNS